MNYNHLMNLTKREKAWVEYELLCLKQHLVVANHPDVQGCLAEIRKELEEKPEVPKSFRIKALMREKEQQKVEK